MIDCGQVRGPAAQCWPMGKYGRYGMRGSVIQRASVALAAALWLATGGLGRGDISVARAQEASSPSGCVMVFGQGRNHDPAQPARNRHWDEVNSAFNLAVREPLVAAGLPVINLVLPVAATDVPANLERLLAEVKRQGCTRVLESTIFADPAAGSVIVRLRAYPVLGLTGPQAADQLPRIGAAQFTQQREYALDERALARLDPSRLGRLMGVEALATGLARTDPTPGATLQRTPSPQRRSD